MGESQSNGIIERAVGLVAGQARTLKAASEHRIGTRVLPDHAAADTGLEKWRGTFALFLSLGVFSWNFGRGGHGPPKLCNWASLGSFCARRLAATIQREDLPREKKRANMGAEEKKESEILGVADGEGRVLAEGGSSGGGVRRINEKCQ